MIATLLLAPGIAQALGPTPATSPTPLTSPTPGSALAQSAVVAIPASWHAETITTKAEVVRRLGKWTNGPDAGESITLDVAPNFGLDLAAIAKATSGNMRNADPKASMLTSGPIRRCQGRPGWKQTFSDAGDGITVVYALTQSRAYFAIYKYPGYPGPSAEGEAAAESLCPPSDPIVHLPPPPISAPAGWRSKDTSAYDTSPGATAWAWDPPLGQPSAEMLFVSEFPMPHAHASLSYRVTALLARYFEGHAAVVQRAPVQLCHSTDGVYVAMTASSSKGPMILESVMTIADRRAYTAIYSRRASVTARPEAERALRSLCPTVSSRSL